MLVIVEKLSLSLDNFANITSNLNAQVQSNSNMLSGISAAVTHSDELVQGRDPLPVGGGLGFLDEAPGRGRERAGRMGG